MKTKYALKGTNSGLYFVTGAGFVAPSVNEASRLTSEEVDGIQQCARNMGIETSISSEVKDSSWAVFYIRKDDVVNGKLVKKAPNGNLGQVDPSKRRFATRDEAITHGSRFSFRRANRGDAVGSAFHKGFYVDETQDAVNSAVNPATGLTNSL